MFSIGWIRDCPNTRASHTVAGIGTQVVFQFGETMGPRKFQSGFARQSNFLKQSPGRQVTQ